MNNIHLSILGSAPFSNVLNELEFNNILNQNNISNHSDKKILVKILFAENLKIKEVTNYLLKNEPTILFLNHKDYIKKNSLKLLDFHVSLELPIEILSFKEILNILITKYNFFKKSKIIIKDYEIDSNERSISKEKVKVKLTEKELELIFKKYEGRYPLNVSLIDQQKKYTINMYSSDKRIDICQELINDLKQLEINNKI